MDQNKLTSSVAAVLVVAVLGTSLAFGQTSADPIETISARVDTAVQTYSGMKTADARADATDILAQFTSFCQSSNFDCTAEIDLVNVGIRGARGPALANIIKNAWTDIQLKTPRAVDNTGATEKKPKKRSISKILERRLRNAAAKEAPKLIEYAGNQVPEDLVKFYNGTAFQDTVNDTAKELGGMLISGSITNAQVENVLRDMFGTATADTAAFANDLMQKYSLQNIATVLITNPRDSKAIARAVQDEIQNYAEEELNKLANQALATMFPIFQGVQVDFTNLNSKNLKSTLRSTIVNALAQSYLGPQYVAVYMAVSAVCPTCMEKTHAELRRFDKKYIRPGTDKIEDEWDRFEDRIKAETSRVGNQIEAEWKRLNKHISAELNRQIDQITNEATRAHKRYMAELGRLGARGVAEIERELNDYTNEAGRAIDRAEAELKREVNDVLNMASSLGKKAEAEVKREAKFAEKTLKSLATKAGAELQREFKSVVNEADKTQKRIEAELKRAADKVVAEAKRAADKAEAEAKRASSRVSKEVKRWKKKLRW